ncbi:RGG repeats nuclear RNA binding protein C-like [Salvia miltiorrhiza]|uniref:RGG repeats nuclear RNA binding protein C-like n=1 Tax=Salvia miltiorrhiza TaxID=226208 RepID=UPI0025AC72FE|nr:RGG repeats nuclear RNA binding protein C-like [Salvia miltiorrhiza]
MAFNGNAFAPLEVDDVENLLAHVSTVTVKSGVPPSAVDKRNDKKAAFASSHSSSVPNEKLSINNRKGQNNRNRVNERINDTRQNRNGGNVNNCVGIERQNRVNPNNSRKPAAFRSNNGSKKATNGNCSGHEEVIEEEEGWQIVRRSRSKDYKQSNANQSRPSTDVNVACKEEEVKVSDDKQHHEENGGDGEKLNGGVQVADEARVEGDEALVKQDKVLVKKEETERLQLEAKKSAELEAKKKELEAKKMTLKQYEKLLEEKRKFMEYMKTEERIVALDTDFNSMHVIAKKNEEEETKLNPASDHHKKKAANNKNNKIVLSQPHAGRFPRRNGNGVSSARLEGSGSDPKAVSVPPPSFKDVQQFPALALNGTTKGK